MNTDFATALDQVIAPPPTGAAPPTPAGAPPLPTPANDTFGAAVDEVASTIRGSGALPDNNRNVEEQRDAQANLLLARRTNPDAAGRAMVAATETGLPSDVAMRNPDVADEEAFKQQSAKLLREARGTAQFFADQRNAAVAHDKVAQMGTWERLMYAASSGAAEGWQDTEISPLVEKEMNGQPLTPGEKTLVEGWREERRVPSGLPDWSVSAGVRNSAAFVTGLTSQLVKSAPLALEGGLAAGGITAVSGLEPLVPVMTAAGASAGLQAGMFDQGRKQATAFTYERLRELQDEKGATLDPQTVRYISNGVGTIGGLLNIIGFGQAAKPVGSLASSVTRLLIEDAAVKPSVGAALRAIGGGTVKGFGMGLGLGAANEASMVGGETLAAEINNILQGTKFTDILNDSAKRDEAARAIADSAINMGLTLAGLHVATGAPRLATEAVRVQRAAADARFYDSVVNGADASGLVDRPTGRDAIQRFLGLQLDDGPHENVYIPAAKLVELYQDAARIGAANDPLLGHIEGLGKQVADALPVNGDVVIPAKDFFSKLVGTPALDKLKGDLRMRDDGLSLNEARDAVAKHGEFLKAEQARWEAQLEAGVAEVDPAARVFEDMRDRLRIKAGYTESTATHQAALYASHYEARAQRSPDLYGDAWEAYQKAGTGKGVEVQATVPEAIRGAAPDRLDVLLNSLRSGKEPTAPEPETLGKFLKRTPGTPDIQARAAHEAGFFPEHTDTPTSEHLAAALAEEKAGRPRISEQAPKDHGETFRADRQQLSDTLKGMGVDPKTATNKQVRTALAKAIEAEDKGPTYDQPVYHGSPHIFDKFTLDHIGTGEGAQAYGWGLYFAGNKQVAKFYRSALNRGRRPTYEVNGKDTPLAGARSAVQDALRAEMSGIDGAAYRHNLAAIMEMLDEGNTTAEIRKVWPTKSKVVDDILNAIDQKVTVKEPGRLYHVEVPEDGAYLLWDEPLSEQPESVKAAIKRLGHEIDDKTGGTGEGPFGAAKFAPVTGGEWYNSLTHARNGEMDPKSLSDMLRSEGVPGIKYLDGSSRTKGEGHHNYVLFDDALATIKQYEQPARGSITFGDNRAIIRLFQGRDLSTLLHESGHLWLAEIEFDAKDPGAPEQLKADYQTVLDFLGSTDGYITREQHEKFARSFETYLMEGKAPSNALAAAFSSFRNWLTQIYRRLSALDAPIDPEMRGVFDRLVASDDAIKSARETQALNPIFKDAKSAGMTEAQFKTYTERATSAVDEAERRTLDKAMEAIRRQRTKEWKADERRVRDDVRSEIMQDPGQRALHLLRTGKMFGAETPEVLLGVKLSKESIVEAYGDDSALRMLPPGIFRDREAGPGVIAADDLASVMGFDTGKAMLDRLMALESQRQAMVEKGDKRSVVKASVDEETARRMGPPIDQQAIADEAMAAVHGDKQAALMGAELAALARRADHAGAQIGLDDVKAWAAKTIGEMPARQVQTFDRFLKAERSAGEAAERALLKGDYLAAFKAKQDQLANSRLYVEAKKAAGEIDSARKLMDRYAGERTIKGMDQDYLDQIHGLLEGYDFKRRSDTEIKKVQGFELWAANQTKEGIDHLGEALSDRMKAQIGKLNYRDLTVDEMRGLADTVKQIAKLGRLSKELVVGLEKRDFDATLNEFQSQLQGIRQLGRPDERNPEVAGAGLRERARAWLVRAKAGARAFDASLLHMEQIADWADGGNPNGLFNTLLFRPFADAQARENDLLGEYAKKMQDAADAVPKEIKAGWTKRIDVPELRDKGRGRGAFLKSDLVAMALNLGNDSNKQKMLRGDGWDEDTVKAVLDKHLVKEDWEFVQRMWDTIEELWPKAAELERRVNGVEAPKIEATPVETKFGTFRGGYYPAAYDLSLSAEARASWAKRQGGLFDENTYTRATTSQGYQKGRTEFSAPILLDLNVIPKHIAQVIHDITHREAIRQAAKIVLDKRFIDGFEGAFGHEFYQIMMPWLQSVAGNLSMDDTGLSWWMKTVKAIRVNTSLVGMGLRGSTMIQQVTGNFDTAEVLGAKWAAVGNAAFVGDPARMLQTRDFVFEKSGEMRHRMDNTERDIREGLRSLLGKNDALSEVRRFAYYGVGMFDMMVSMPAWMGGYKKALSEGMADHDAVYYADKVVRLSQGAGGVKDLAAVQSSRNEMMKLFSMFYSWASHFYNRQRDIGRSATEAEGGHDFAMIAARSIFLMVLPALSGPLLTGNGPKDDESWTNWTLRNVGFGLFAGVPIARDVASVANQKMGGGFGSYAVTPAARGYDALEAVTKDAWRGMSGEGDVSDKWVKHAIEAPGYIFGLPTGQVGSTAQFLWDLHTGNQTAESAGEWYRGLLTGKAHNE